MARFRTTCPVGPEPTRARAGRRWRPVPRQLPDEGRRRLPERARTSQTLARLTVRKLRKMKVRRVRLAFDDSYFTGPAVNPAWPSTYIPEDVVPPISSLWVDQGQDPTGYGFVPDPAATAAQTFRSALQRNGLKVRPQVAPRSRSPGGRRRRLGVQRSARRDRGAHPRGQRQPGGRGAGPPRRPGRAAGGLLRGRRRIGPRRAASGSAYRWPATSCTTAAGSPAATGSATDTLAGVLAARRETRTSRGCGRC